MTFSHKTVNILFHIRKFLSGKDALNSEEVGQAGRIASWVPMPNCARDFIDSMTVAISFPEHARSRVSGGHSSGETNFSRTISYG